MGSASRSSGPLPHRPAPLGSFPGTPHSLDPADSPAGLPPAGPQKSLPSADLMILNSAGPPITWGTLPTQLGPGLVPVGLEKCGLPSASSEIGSASRVVWGHRGGSTLGEPLLGGYSCGPSVRTPRSQEEHGEEVSLWLAVGGVKLSLAMIRSVIVTLQRPHLPCAQTQASPSRAHMVLPAPRAHPASCVPLLASHPLLTHPNTNSLSACCVPSTTAEPRTLQGQSLPPQSCILEWRWIMIR